jgi:hypothetical protein
VMHQSQPLKVAKIKGVSHWCLALLTLTLSRNENVTKIILTDKIFFKSVLN